MQHKGDSMIEKKIEECRKSIDSLVRLLQIIGSGILILVGLFSFLEEKFNLIAAQSILMISVLLLVGVLFGILRKHAIIEKLNLRERK